MPLNVKIPTIIGILTFMSRINFVLSSVEYENSFITLDLVQMSQFISLVPTPMRYTEMIIPDPDRRLQRSLGFSLFSQNTAKRLFVFF